MFKSKIGKNSSTGLSDNILDKKIFRLGMLYGAVDYTLNELKYFIHKQKLLHDNSEEFRDNIDWIKNNLESKINKIFEET